MKKIKPTKKMSDDREKDKLIERRNRLTDQLLAIKNNIKSIEENIKDTDLKLKALGVVEDTPNPDQPEKNDSHLASKATAKATPKLKSGGYKPRAEKKQKSGNKVK